jgi:acetone carboxylase gamma subunit
MSGAIGRLHVHEHLEVDLDAERWHCRGCDRDLGSAREDYKRGLLVAERDPAEVHPAGFEGEYTFAPKGDWIRIIEFYCPGCARQVETEYLPPGHPLTHDTQLDLDAIKTRLETGQARIDADGKLVTLAPSRTEVPA